MWIIFIYIARYEFFFCDLCWSLSPPPCAVRMKNISSDGKKRYTLCSLSVLRDDEFCFMTLSPRFWYHWQNIRYQRWFEHQKYRRRRATMRFTLKEFPTTSNVENQFSLSWLFLVFFDVMCVKATKAKHTMVGITKKQISRWRNKNISRICKRKQIVKINVQSWICGCLIFHCCFIFYSLQNITEKEKRNYRRGPIVFDYKEYKRVKMFNFFPLMPHNIYLFIHSLSAALFILG